jgi:hypothetical protein
MKDRVKDKTRAAVQARDLRRINAALDSLNSEAADVLEYQASEEPRQRKPSGGRSSLGVHPSSV